MKFLSYTAIALFALPTISSSEFLKESPEAFQKVM